MIFDAHCDVWTDVVQKRNKGQKDIIRNFHYKRMMKSGVKGGIFVIWVDPPYDENPKARTMEIIKNMSVEITGNKDVFSIVRKYDDIEKAVNSNKLAIVAGMEGLSAIGTDVDYLNALYLFGIRHASLTWNEQNDLATGVRGDESRGLTEFGVKAVHKMEELGMLVDVSHANEKTFWDIYNNTKKPFIASHSNCKALCKNRRNLSDEQLKAIAERGGVVGLNAYAAFVHDDPTKLDAEHLIDHVEHMINIMGIDHVGFGFDFSDFLESDTLNHFLESEVYGTKDLEDVTKLPEFIERLKKRGYTEGQLEKIYYKNMLRVLKKIL